jgi:hypothetical protein
MQPFSEGGNLPPQRVMPRLQAGRSPPGYRQGRLPGVLCCCSSLSFLSAPVASGLLMLLLFKKRESSSIRKPARDHDAVNLAAML